MTVVFTLWTTTSDTDTEVKQVLRSPRVSLSPRIHSGIFSSTPFQFTFLKKLVDLPNFASWSLKISP